MSKLIEESPETLEKCGERIFEAVNWDVLAHIASELRHDTPCHFEKDFLIVDSNMLRKIVFKDDVHWGAMLRLPILDPAYYHRKGLGVTGTFETEIFGMNFIRYVTAYLSNTTDVLTLLSQNKGQNFYTRSRNSPLRP